MPEVHKVFGPPGTGKTTYICSKIKEVIEGGVSADKVACVSFTKASAVAFRDKLSIPRKNKNFGTLHSLALKLLKDNGTPLTLISDVQREKFVEGLPGFDTLFWRLYDLESSNIKRFNEFRSGHLNYGVSVNWSSYYRFCSSYRSFKKRWQVTDFSDWLDALVGSGITAGVSHAFVDEAQDLSATMWAVVLQIFADAKSIWVAGDDDQAIHAWAGASVESFLGLKCDTLKVLEYSHRLPKKVKDFSQRIVKRIRYRQPKEFKADKEGGVFFVHSLKHLLKGFNSSGTWMFLARTTHFLSIYKSHLESLGVFFVIRGGQSINFEVVVSLYRYLLWQDSESEEHRTKAQNYFETSDIGCFWGLALKKKSLRVYLEAIIKRYPDIESAQKAQDKSSDIIVDTIHGVKGLEAKNVVVSPNITRRVNISLSTQSGRDEENRIFYTGATRAEENLYILGPTSKYSYSFIR